MTSRTFAKVFFPLAVGLAGASAFAQTNPNQGLPAGHPPLDVPPGQARPLPGQARPAPGQMGRPMAGQPGQGMPGRPGFPGMQRQPQRAPVPAHVAHVEEAAHGGGHGGHCPGHGPHDAPHFDQINWWHGMIAVNNEKAIQPGFVNKLLWRYENHSDPCDPKNEPPPFLASILNLGVLGFILYRFGKKPIGDALVKRKQSIMSEIDNAARLKNEAQKRLDEYEDKFERLAETLDTVKAEYAAQAELEKKHIIAEAEERRARMRRDAEFRIEQELRTARIELMREAVQDATAAAEEMIRSRAAQADLDRMSEDYLGSVREALASGGTAGGAQ
ncbi:F0F1 ATP synthase subunit B [Polyangium spumosum]|uniref:ATP synthase subunit b n=1 Tax=Polyangium spumosum TaxID=889282 RepID=A0A6N7PVM3_9BACT|nr:F0F1 ATP synthase subunit B [Polyangium spumosum]MRG92861.1 F0F1 ATP synthase subunit B [Polyangium spumosum]